MILACRVVLGCGRWIQEVKENCEWCGPWGWAIEFGSGDVMWRELYVVMHGGGDCLATQARLLTSDFVEDYRKEALKTMSGPVERTTITLHPEYALVYLVHVLAHHPNYPVASGGVQPEPAAYEPFFRCVVLELGG